MTEAALTYPPVGSVAVKDVTSIVLSLTPGQANDLYNEIYALLRDRDVISARDRHRAELPALYAVYDALAACDVHGDAPGAVRRVP